MGEPLVWIEDRTGQTSIGVPVVINENVDVATVKSLKTTTLPSIPMFEANRVPELGSEIISLGFPSYYGLACMFEVGHVKDTYLLNDTKTILSRDLTYMGYSGGPVVDVRTKTVLGLATSMSEIVKELPPLPDKTERHQHLTLAQVVSIDEVRVVLAQTKDLLEKS